MKLTIKSILLFFLATSATCAFAQQTEERHFSGFNEVSVGGSMDVYIKQGDNEGVRLEGPGDELKHVLTDINDGSLRIHRDDEDFNWHNLFSSHNRHHKKVVVYVTAKKLNSISLGGSGYVSFKDGIHANALKLRVSGSGNMVGVIDAKSLESSVSGSGNMSISGKAESSAVRVSGSGGYNAKDVVTANTSVHVSGSGGAEVNANNRIDASVSGSGDIRYTGDVKNISTSKSGSGSISRN